MFDGVCSCSPVKQLENGGVLDKINEVDVRGGSSRFFLFFEHKRRRGGGYSGRWRGLQRTSASGRGLR
jgi:hypothetical protein